MVVFPEVVRGRDFNTSAEMTPHVCLVDVICQRSKAPPPGFQPLQRQQEIPDSSTATRSAGAVYCSIMPPCGAITTIARHINCEQTCSESMKFCTWRSITLDSGLTSACRRLIGPQCVRKKRKPSAANSAAKAGHSFESR